MGSDKRTSQTRLWRVLGFEPGPGDYLALGLLAAGFGWLFQDALFSGGVFFLRDVCQEIVPKRGFLAASMGKALWDPYEFFGLPLAANSQWSAFYPLNFLFSLGPAPRMVTVFILLHFALGLFPAYVLGRSVGFRPASALAAAASFGLGGFFLSLGNLAVVLTSAAWIMPLLWAAGRAVKTGEAGFIAAAGVFWGLMVLGGEPEIAYLSGMVLVIFLFWLWRAGLPEASWKPFLFRCIKVTAAALAIATGLSAVQWVLSLELAGLSNRAGGLSFAEAVKWSVQPVALLNFLVPNLLRAPDNTWSLGILGDKLPYILSFYPGVAAFGLAAAALIIRRRPPLVLAAGCALFVLLSLGEHGLLYRLFYLALPGFDHFRIPERCLFGFAALFPLLVGTGAEALAGPQNDEDEPARPFLPAGFLAAGVALAALHVFRARGFALHEGAGVEAMAELRLAMFSSQALRSAAVISLFMGIFLFPWREGRRGLLPWALAALIAADLVSCHFHLNPTVAPEFYSLEGNLAGPLAQGPREDRWLVMPPPSLADKYLGLGEDPVEFFREQRKNLTPFAGLELGIKDAGARSSFYPGDCDLYFGLVNRASQKDKERIFAMSGIRQVLQPGSEPFPVAAALPRAFLAPQASFLTDRDEVLARFETAGFNPAATVLLEGTGEEPEASWGADRVFTPLPVTDLDNDTVLVGAPKGIAGWLVLLDFWYPGWTAKMGDRELPLRRANGFFRAVPLSGEEGTVEFSYRPAGYRAGLVTSLLFAAVAAVLIFRRAPGLIPGMAWFIILVIAPLGDGGGHHYALTAIRVCAFLLAAAWALRLRCAPELALYRTRIDYLVLALWGVSAYAMLRADYFYLALHYEINILTFIVLYYVAAQSAAGEGGRGASERLMTMAAAGAVLQSVWALAETGSGERAGGGFFNPNYLAGLLMIVSPYALSMALSRLHERRRAALIWAAALVLMIAAMLTTASRALIVLPFALMVPAIGGGRDLLRARGTASARSLRVSLAVTAAVIFAGLAAAALVPNPLRTRIMGIENDVYASERPRIWLASLQMALDHPLGVGLGMYRYYFPRYAFPTEGVMAGRYEKTATTAHQEYLQAACEGSIAFALVLLLPAALLIYAGAKKGGFRARGLAGGILAAALHAGVDSNLHNPSAAALAALLGGLLAAELHREHPGWLLPVDLTRGGRTGIAAAFAAVFLLAAPFFIYLGWGYGLTARLAGETGLGRTLRGAQTAIRHGMGNTLPYKILSQALVADFSSSQNIESLKKGLQAARLAAELNPADPALLIQNHDALLWLYRISGHRPFLEDARAACQRALALAPFNADYLERMVEADLLAGKKEEAIAGLQKAVALEPHDLAARLSLVSLLLDAGRAEEARREWEDLGVRMNEAAKRRRQRPEAFASPYRSRRITVNQDDWRRVESRFESAAGR